MPPAAPLAPTRFADETAGKRTGRGGDSTFSKQ
jgi:hypothetical protein